MREFRINRRRTSKSTANQIGHQRLDQLEDRTTPSAYVGKPVSAVGIGNPASAAPPPAKVIGVTINSKQTGDERSQRSRVGDVAITFDSIVSFVSSPPAAFTLDRVSPTPGFVTLAALVNNSGPGSVVTLTFTGGAVENISLQDGRYALHALAAQFAGSGLDGDGNGIAGDNFIFDEPLAPSPLDVNKVFRVCGDYTGDGVVAVNDFIYFRLALGGTSFGFDFDNDGVVAASDFIIFKHCIGP